MPRVKHRSSLWLGSALLLVALGVQPARGQGVGASLTTTTVAEAHGDNHNAHDDDDDYGLLQERLNLGVNAGELAGSLRLDGDLFLLAPDASYQQNLRLERLAFSWAPDGWTLDAGDYYQQLGRGIVLSVRKVNEAGLDVAIRGLRVAYHGEAQELTLFAGHTNPVNVDAINQRYVADPEDLLAGGSYQITPLPALRLGAVGLYHQPRERLLDELDFTVTSGAFAELPALAEWLALSAEIDVQYRVMAGRAAPGTAGFIDANLRFGDLALLAEALLLHAFEQKGSRNTALGSRFDYNQPPTLERIDQEVANNRDVVGGRLRTEYFVSAAELLLYVSVMLRVNAYGEASELYQLHGFTGAELVYQDGRSRLSGSVGARYESRALFTNRSPLKDMMHVDLDWVQALWGAVALHLTSDNQLWTFQGRRYQRGSTVVGVEQGGLGGLAFELGYDTQDPSPGAPKLFYAGIGSWELSEHLLVRFIGGTQRGGIKCVAGICREYPAFTGARVEVVTRLP